MISSLLLIVALSATEEINATPVGDEPQASAAPAAAVSDVSPEKKDEGKVEYSGSIAPQVRMAYRPNAVPSKKWGFGADNTLVVLSLSQTVLPNVGYTVYAEVSEQTVSFEEASVFVQPLDGLKITVGRMPVPFSAESSSLVTRRLFPTRAPQTEAMLPPTDLGALAEYELKGGFVTASAGAFNGSGVALGTGKDRGYNYAFRLSVSPLGATPATVDAKGGGLRATVGTGLAYYPSVMFGPEGFIESHAGTVLVDVSLKLAYAGFALQTEYMRRERDESVSQLTNRRTAWYAQASYFQPLTAKFGVAPIVRYGRVTRDQTFVPDTEGGLEAGVSMYVAKGDDPTGAAKLSLVYSGRYFTTDGDSQHIVTLLYVMTF